MPFAQRVNFIRHQGWRPFCSSGARSGNLSSINNAMDSHSLFLIGKELYGKHNNSNRNHNLNSAISTDNGEVVSTSVPMSIPLMIRLPQRPSASMMASKNLDDGVMFMISLSFLHRHRFFQELPSLAQVSFRGADISNCHFINGSNCSATSFWDFRYRFSVQFRAPISVFAPSCLCPPCSLNLFGRMLSLCKSCRGRPRPQRSSICMIMHVSTDYQQHVQSSSLRLLMGSVKLTRCCLLCYNKKASIVSYACKSIC